MAAGKKGVIELLAATHAGMTADEFSAIASNWIKTAKHPRFKRLYTECVYQPQLELMSLPARERFSRIHRVRRWY